MAKSHDLRRIRSGTVINLTSKQQETDLGKALVKVEQHLKKRFDKGVTLIHQKTWHLKDIVKELRRTYPETDFHYYFDSTYLQPDGGILSLESKQKDAFSYPILIAEVKNQGTNDRRAKEGLPKQSKGNAIERLGKNLIALRTALLRESIFPFVCFGCGCDFASNSSILDRATQMAMFGHLNKTYLFDQEAGKFKRGSFYFRPQQWTVREMYDVMKDIAERAVLYYFSKYTEGYFR